MTGRPIRCTARWVLPVSDPPIRDGAVLVDGSGRIAGVGSADAVPRPDGALDVPLGEAALLPGLVNAHAHLELSFCRGLLEDLPFTDWIAALLRVKSSASLAEADFLAAARWSCVEMLAAGITTVAATEDSTVAMSALRESGQRGIVFREVFGPSPDQVDASMAGLRAELAAMHEMESDLVRAGVSPHAPFSVSDKLFNAVAALAREQDLPVAVHIAESAAETDLVVLGSGVFADRLNARGIATPPRGRSPIDLLDRTGILDTAPLLIHCVQVDAEDIERIAAAGAPVAHCPAANGRFGHGVAPIARMIEAGVCVALGSDSVGSNNRIDLLEEARLTQLFQRASTGTAALLPAHDVLRLATLGGARSLGVETRTGSLEPGKDADLCAVSLEGAHVRPVTDPVAAVVLAARASDVVLTVVRGRTLYSGGRVHTTDAAAARIAVDRAAERASAALADSTDPVDGLPSPAAR